MTLQTPVGERQCIIGYDNIRTLEHTSLHDYHFDFRPFIASGTLTVQLIGTLLTLTPEQYFWYRYWCITLWQSDDVWHFDDPTGTVTGEIIIFGKCVLTSNNIKYDGCIIRPSRQFRINGSNVLITNHGQAGDYLPNRSQVLAFVAMSLALDSNHDLIY